MTKINTSILQMACAVIVCCCILMSAAPTDAVLFGTGMKPAKAGYQLKFYPFASWC